MKAIRQAVKDLNTYEMDGDDSDDGPEKFFVKTKNDSVRQNRQRGQEDIHSTPNVISNPGKQWGAGRGRPQAKSTNASSNHRGGYQGRGNAYVSHAGQGRLEPHNSKASSTMQKRFPNSSQEKPASVVASKTAGGPQNKPPSMMQNKGPRTSQVSTRRPYSTRADPSKNARDKFPRVNPLNTLHAMSKAEYEEQAVDEKQAIEVLRRKPDDTVEFRVTGAFVWPLKEVDQAELGTDQARLDRIRRDFNCTICFDQRFSAFRVYAHNTIGAEANVSDSIEALKIVLSEYLARKSKMVKIYMLDSPAKQSDVQDIQILDATSAAASCFAVNIGLVKKTEKVCLLMPSKNRTGIEWERNMKVSAAKNSKLLSLAMSACLKKTRYRQGFVQIRAIFGAFVFHRYVTSFPGASPPSEIEPMVSFADNLRSSITDGTLYRLSTAAYLFENVAKCTELFDHFGNEGSSLAEARPVQSGTWVFRSSNAKDPIDLQLLVETSPDDDPNEEALIRSSEWSTSAEHQGSRYLEIFMIAPQKGLSWKLEASSQQWHRNIEPNLRSFQSTISTLSSSKINTKTLGSAELVFDFRFVHGLGLKDFYQKTQWKYRLKVDDSLIFEITRLDRFDPEKIKNRGMGELSPEARQPVKSEWEACIYHERWDEHLGQNATLGPGKCAKWDPSLDNFFPTAKARSGDTSKETGFADFVDVLQATSARLSEILLRPSN